MDTVMKNQTTHNPVGVQSQVLTSRCARRGASRLGLALCLCASVVAFPGCTSNRDPNLAGPEYPAVKKQMQTLDIQVVRSETGVTLTNTTARSFGRSRLWINRWYSREIESLGVGETLELPLNSFRDIYGESFRAGGFWATREPQRVELVQLETADSMLGLVAVGKVGE